MKKGIACLLTLVLLMLAGCTGNSEETSPAQTQPEISGTITEITLGGDSVTVAGDETAVYTSRDIVYYEDRDAYDSGNPYGEGEAWERHSAQEAEKHLVVNITKPGTYRLRGELNPGQIRVDLGEDAYHDPNGVVNLILDGVNIQCTVAPAILFQNVYECDGSWSVENAQPDVDTSPAGANLILAENSENTVSGSHVARIYKDKEGEKKLWKQDGAVYSYMSLNVYGPGALTIHADNEGLDTELHLTIHGGDLNIFSGNDGINTNEDGVSVTTILDGNLCIVAGLGAEGDGIDSNGYLVIRGGNVLSAANPAADAGLDSDLGSYIHGGTVVALGSSMDWAESDSGQVTMNLQFAAMQPEAGVLSVRKTDGTEVFSFNPAVLGEYARQFSGMVISSPDLQVGESYQLYLDGVRQAYTGTDVMGRPGGFGGQGPGADLPQMPEGEAPPVQGDRTPPEGGMSGNDRPEKPEGEMPGQPPEQPEGEMPGQPPEQPEGEMPTFPEGQEPPDGFGMPGDRGSQPDTEPGNDLFYMQDKVNFFSGIQAAE